MHPEVILFLQQARHQGRDIWQVRYALGEAHVATRYAAAYGPAEAQAVTDLEAPDGWTRAEATILFQQQ